jgi:hypothetical protein
VNEETFITYFIQTLSLFHFKNLTKSFISDTFASHACIFFLFWFVYNFLLSYDIFQVNMILQGKIWIFIQIIYFLIDVLTSVDTFYLSSLNFSLSFRSMSNDSILVATLYIQNICIPPLLNCFATSYSIRVPAYACKESVQLTLHLLRLSNGAIWELLPL